MLDFSKISPFAFIEKMHTLTSHIRTHSLLVYTDNRLCSDKSMRRYLKQMRSDYKVTRAPDVIVRAFEEKQKQLDVLTRLTENGITFDNLLMYLNVSASLRVSETENLLDDQKIPVLWPMQLYSLEIYALNIAFNKCQCDATRVGKLNVIKTTLANQITDQCLQNMSEVSFSALHTLPVVRFIVETHIQQSIDQCSQELNCVLDALVQTSMYLVKDLQFCTHIQNKFGSSLFQSFCERLQDRVRVHQQHLAVIQALDIYF